MCDNDGQKQKQSVNRIAADQTILFSLCLFLSLFRSPTCSPSYLPLLNEPCRNCFIKYPILGHDEVNSMFVALVDDWVIVDNFFLCLKEQSICGIIGVGWGQTFALLATINYSLLKFGCCQKTIHINWQECHEKIISKNEKNIDILLLSLLSVRNNQIIDLQISECQAPVKSTFYISAWIWLIAV